MIKILRKKGKRGGERGKRRNRYESELIYTPVIFPPIGSTSMKKYLKLRNCVIELEWS